MLKLPKEQARNRLYCGLTTRLLHRDNGIEYTIIDGVLNYRYIDGNLIFPSRVMPDGNYEVHE